MKGLLFSLCIGPAVPHLWCSAAPQTASWTLEARKKAALFLSWTASHTSNPGECSRMGVLTHFYFLIFSRVMQRIPSGTNTMRRLWLTELRTGDESAPINSLTCSVWLRGLLSKLSPGANSACNYAALSQSQSHWAKFCETLIKS